MQIASFEKRLIAYLIDLIFSLAFSTIIFLFLFHNLWKFTLISGIFFIPLLSSFMFIIFCGFASYFTNGYTLGNGIVGLKMVSIKYQKLSLRQIMIKYLPLSLLPAVIINGIYMLTKHTEKTIFDELSHTVCVYMK